MKFKKLAVRPFLTPFLLKSSLLAFKFRAPAGHFYSNAMLNHMNIKCPAILRHVRHCFISDQSPFNIPMHNTDSNPVVWFSLLILIEKRRSNVVTHNDIFVAIILENKITK